MQLTGKILLVDDDPDNILLLKTILRQAGLDDVLTTTDPFGAVSMFSMHHPDLVVLDLHMPGLNGFTLLGELRRQMGNESVPLIVVTSDDSPQVKERALRAGAVDFLHKPFDPVEIELRIENHLRASGLRKQLRRQNDLLDVRVQERTAELESARSEMLERLAIAAEYRDDDTGQHARRVGALSGVLARGLGLGEQQAAVIERAAALHDIGKIGVPDAILHKPGPLEDHEFQIIKKHTAIGAGILSGSRSRLLQVAETIAATHHERWDGRGYEGLDRDETPIEGRIVAAADSFDAMTSDRPYRRAMSHTHAIEEMTGLEGSQFDPAILHVLFRALEQKGLREVTCRQ